MIRAIVYDAVGTLMHVTPSVEAVYAEVGRRFGAALEAEEIRCRFLAAFAEQDRLDEANGWRTSEARERERWHEIVASVFREIADRDACFQALFDTFASPRVWEFDADWPDVSRVVYELGIRQAIASNFDARLHGLVAAMPHCERIERVIVSSEVGWRKPAPEFFARLIDSLQMNAAEIVFVGDDRANDFEPARKLGMHAVLFDPGRRHLDAGQRVEQLNGTLDYCVR